MFGNFVSSPAFRIVQRPATWSTLTPNSQVLRSPVFGRQALGTGFQNPEPCKALQLQTRPGSEGFGVRRTPAVLVPGPTPASECTERPGASHPGHFFASRSFIVEGLRRADPEIGRDRSHSRLRNSNPRLCGPFCVGRSLVDVLRSLSEISPHANTPIPPELSSDGTLPRLGRPLLSHAGPGHR